MPPAIPTSESSTLQSDQHLPLARVVCIGPDLTVADASCDSSLSLALGRGHDGIAAAGSSSGARRCYRMAESGARAVYNISFNPTTARSAYPLGIAPRLNLRVSSSGERKDTGEEDGCGGDDNDNGEICDRCEADWTVSVALRDLDAAPGLFERRPKRLTCSRGDGAKEHQRRDASGSPGDRSEKPDSRGKLSQGDTSGRASSGPQRVAAWVIPPRKGPNTIPTILVYRQPDLSNLMRDIPDDTPWSELALAGTHDSTAFHGVPYAQCQSGGTSVTEQLENGIRSLDLRMRVENNDLIMYHGITSQRARFRDVLSEMYAFLQTHPTESLLVSIKEEVPPIHPEFSRLVYEAMQPYPAHASNPSHTKGEQSSSTNEKEPHRTGTGQNPFWYLTNSRVPTVGDVRGKAILMARFPMGEEWGDQTGWRPPWPDNRREGFEWEMDDGTLCRVQDYYDVPNPLSIQDKFEATVAMLAPTLTSSPLPCSENYKTGTPTPPLPDRQANSGKLSDDTSRQTLTISYASGGSIPLAPPRVVATGLGFPSWGLGVWGVNHRLVDWLLDVIAFDTVDGSDGRQSLMLVSASMEMERAERSGEGDKEERKGIGMKRLRGIIPLDFYKDDDGKGSAIVEILALMNEAGLTGSRALRPARSS